MITATHHKPLNPEQLTLLQWLYTVRFSSTKQLTIRLHKASQQTIQDKLKILEVQGFIGKHYDKSYRLAGRPAEYFLTPKGARELEKHIPDSTNEWAVKALYKNKTVSPDFIVHCLNVADTILKLQAVYGDKLRLFTKSDMVAYDYFPTWKPDLFLSFKPKTKQDTPRRYFLDVWDDTIPFFVSVRKARMYLTYAEEGDWPTDKHALPTVLALCQNDTTEKKLRRQMRRVLEEKYITDEMEFATVTRERLDKATAASKAWLKADEDSTSMNL